VSFRIAMLNDRENILSALREKPLKVYEIMKRANVANEETCQSLLLKMRDEGLVKFDIHKGRWLIGWSAARPAKRFARREERRAYGSALLAPHVTVADGRESRARIA